MNQPTQPVIEIHDLRKSFGAVQALRGLSMTIAPGEIHGFLGPNGAGKSTTIRILLGMIRADGGSARVFGQDSWADASAIHRRVAYVPGDVTLWPSLTGGQVMDLLARLRGHDDPTRRAELLSRFQLDPDLKCRAYSKGNRQKVALVSALASDADLLILDEPTSGLDPLMEEAFRDVLQEDQQRRPRTVLLSSHILSEVEALCDQLTIIREGQVVESGSLREMRHITGTRVVAEVDRVPAGLADLPGLSDLVVDGHTVSFAVHEAGLDQAMRGLSTAGLRSLTAHPPTLEELFLRHYATETSR